MDLEFVYDRIVIILWDLIVIFDRNVYHSLACILHLKHAVVRLQAALWGRGLLSSFAAMAMITQKVLDQLICRRMRQIN